MVNEKVIAGALRPRGDTSHNPWQSFPIVVPDSSCHNASICFPDYNCIRHRRLTKNNTLTRIENPDIINSQTAAGSRIEPLDYSYELPTGREYVNLSRYGSGCTPCIVIRTGLSPAYSYFFKTMCKTRGESQGPDLNRSVVDLQSTAWPLRHLGIEKDPLENILWLMPVRISLKWSPILMKWKRLARRRCIAQILSFQDSSLTSKSHLTQFIQLIVEKMAGSARKMKKLLFYGLWVVLMICIVPVVALTAGDNNCNGETGGCTYPSPSFRGNVLGIAIPATGSQ